MYGVVVFSAVVPAYNEASILHKSLEPLDYVAGQLDGEVVVVPNGCTDNTATVARSYRNLTVLEQKEAGKSAALNAGDGSCTKFPRLFFDADLSISSTDLIKLIERLGDTDALLVSPRMRLDTSQSSWLVSAFYRFWSSLPAFRVRTGGLYGLTEKGRARFDQFPPISADDSFVRSRFTQSEVEIASDIVFEAVAPRLLADLIAVRKRIKRGNAALRNSYDPGQAIPQNNLKVIVKQSLASPQSLLDATVFLLVSVWVLLALKIEKPNESVWERDESSRNQLRKSV